MSTPKDCRVRHRRPSASYNITTVLSITKHNYPYSTQEEYLKNIPNDKSNVRIQINKSSIASDSQYSMEDLNHYQYMGNISSQIA